MSLYCKVECTLEELEVIRVELVTRGMRYIDTEYTEDKMREDFINDTVTHIALYNDGKAFGWVDKDDPMETIDFQLFMRRLDMNLPPRRAFRKVATYKMPYYQTIEK
ncbi:hypothetical protein [Porphyromonas somerae]|uniref:hypothetical protein n=1 Tax=Porphyromonas somerae TaxID=322095 RepID=UPI001FCC7F71|nr:hypothetical protein [Porphyromonas somerae]BDE81801.1 hypothetical protein CE91St14_08290 [Porphyromonas somerae]